jgi:hypothetical protein
LTVASIPFLEKEGGIRAGVAGAMRIARKRNENPGPDAQHPGRKPIGPPGYEVRPDAAGSDVPPSIVW